MYTPAIPIVLVVVVLIMMRVRSCACVRVCSLGALGFCYKIVAQITRIMAAEKDMAATCNYVHFRQKVRARDAHAIFNYKLRWVRSVLGAREHAPTPDLCVCVRSHFPN